MTLPVFVFWLCLLFLLLPLSWLASRVILLLAKPWRDR